jgi:hypothetical protein
MAVVAMLTGEQDLDDPCIGRFSEVESYSYGEAHAG